MRSLYTRSFVFVLVALICFSQEGFAQSSNVPMTSPELVNRLYELPRYPEKRDELIEEIRTRGIGFQLTDGMRSLVATKSRSDALLRRTLEEAERRRINPVKYALPPEAESNQLLTRARTATLAAAEAMPDFLVRQLIRRSVAYGNTKNWIPQDNLAIAVSYRAAAGEEYKVLTVNGLPLGQEVTQGRDYSKYVGGASSSGVEYISALADVFKPETGTSFRAVDTDVLQGRRTIVYEYEVKREFSRLTLSADRSLVANVGSRGRIWLDRERDRVLRFEQIATEIPGDFPITAAKSVIDYGWVTISEKEYLLPTRSEILITTVSRGQALQSRNEIRFRDYQKFGAELKVIDEIDDEDFPPEKP